MDNEKLFEKTRSLVATERRIGSEILECLQEIETRRAYFDLRYDGLYSYCVKDLGFTESQAYQRIQAMRALKEVPELKPLIESGSLTVSAISKVQNHIRKEKNNGKKILTAAKRDLFLAVQNCTSKEVDRKICEIRGEPEKTKLFLEMDENLSRLWEKAKNLAAHRSRGNPSEVLRIIAKDWVDRHDPLVRHAFQKAFESVTFRRLKTEMTGEIGDTKKMTGNFRDTKEMTGEIGDTKEMNKLSAVNPSRMLSEADKCRTISWSTSLDMSASRNAAQTSPENRHRPSADLRHRIWVRDNGKCTRCRSEHALEVDHIIPFACGGLTIEDNLRLLCSSCNRTRAAKTFGPVRPSVCERLV